MRQQFLELHSMSLLKNLEKVYSSSLPYPSGPLSRSATKLSPTGNMATLLTHKCCKDYTCLPSALKLILPINFSFPDVFALMVALCTYRAWFQLRRKYYGHFLKVTNWSLCEPQFFMINIISPHGTCPLFGNMYILLCNLCHLHE